MVTLMALHDTIEKLGFEYDCCTINPDETPVCVMSQERFSDCDGNQIILHAHVHQRWDEPKDMMNAIVYQSGDGKPMFSGFYKAVYVNPKGHIEYMTGFMPYAGAVVAAYNIAAKVAKARESYHAQSLPS
jgi:hypothetical protein